MKKRTLCGLLVLVCGLLLTACGSAGAGSDSGVENGSNSAALSTEVTAAVEMQAGFYDDETTYGCRPEYIADEKYVQPDYYGVEVGNITENSFDFTLHLYHGEEKAEKMISTGMARFVEDGTKAVCTDAGLTFVFPNEWNSLPTVVDFRIEGFEPVRDVLFVNNDIPGYEFG